MPNRPDSLEKLQLTHELLRPIRKDRTVSVSELRQKLMDADTKYTRELRAIQRVLETSSGPDYKVLTIERDENNMSFRYHRKESAKGIATGAPREIQYLFKDPNLQRFHHQRNT